MLVDLVSARMEANAENERGDMSFLENETETETYIRILMPPLPVQVLFKSNFQLLPRWGPGEIFSVPSMTSYIHLPNF